MDILNNIHMIQVPVPYPLKTVNCYLIDNKGNWSMIDTGANTEEAKQFWNDVFKKKGIKKGSLTDIYITHIHPDHMGLAGWFQEQHNCKVHMTKSNQERMIFEWENIIKFADLLKQKFLQNGCPESLAEKIKEVTIEQQKEVLPLPNDIEEMKVNTRLTLGKLHYDILPFPGHCDTLITLWNDKNKVFISSDSILPHITPNVGVWPEVKPNPLKRFLNSLEKIIELEPVITLPGHGSSMKDTISRANSIITHHKNRLREMNLLIKKGYDNAFEIASKHFNLEKLNTLQIRFALAETLAHMEYLKYEEKI